MKRVLSFIALGALLWLGFLIWRVSARPPALRDGDLIFQSSHSQQSTAIFAATFSPYTHVGIIERRGGKVFVVEADGPVKATPLQTWIVRGRFSRYAVYRYQDLTSKRAKAVLAAAHSYDGRPYDLVFSFGNRAIYCSELPYLAFRAAGVPVGHVQTIRDLHIDNGLVRALIAKRWRQDPACNGKTFDQCLALIEQRPLITPRSIAADSHLHRLFSNYPW